MAEDPRIQKLARRRFEELFDNEQKVDRNEMLVETMEELLYEKRRIERNM